MRGRSKSQLNAVTEWMVLRFHWIDSSRYLSQHCECLLVRISEYLLSSTPPDFPQPTHTFTSVGCQLTIMIGDVPFSPIKYPGGPAPLRRYVIVVKRRLSLDGLGYYYGAREI